MKLTPLNIPEVLLLEPNIFGDDRGFFFESFNQKEFNNLIGRDLLFVQDNHSKSKKGVLRGIHYQDEPFMQEKLIRVIKGEIYDVVLDVRKNSTTYGQWVSQLLSSKNNYQLFIPKGFAHGFLSLKEGTEVIYKISKPYKKSHERVIKFNDQRFNITWPKLNIEFILSEKDKV